MVKRELYSHWDKTLLKDEIVIHVGSEENEPTNSKGLMRCFWALPRTTKSIHNSASLPTSIISSPSSHLFPFNLLPATHFPPFPSQTKLRLSTGAKLEFTARAFSSQATPTMSFPSSLLSFVGLCDQVRSGDVPQSPTCSNASSGTNGTVKTSMLSFSTLDNDMLEVDSLLESSKDAESFSDTADHWQELDDIQSAVGPVDLVFDDVPDESPSPSFSDCSDVQQSCSARHTTRISYTNQQESLNIDCACGRRQRFVRGSLCAGSSHSLDKEGTNRGGGCEAATKDEKLSSDSVESIAERRDLPTSIDSDLQADSSGSESSMRANASRSSLSIGLFGDSRTSSALCLSPNFPDSDRGHVYPPASGYESLASSCASASDSAADCVPSICGENTDRSRVYKGARLLQSPTKLRGLFEAARRRVKSFGGAEGTQQRRLRHASFSDMLKSSKPHATDGTLGGAALSLISGRCTERERSDTLRPYEVFPGPSGHRATKLAEPTSKRARRMSLPVNTGFVRRMSTQFGWLERDENPEPSSTRTSPKKAKQLRARLSSTFTFRDLTYKRVECSGVHTACAETDFGGGRQARGIGAPVRPVRESVSLLSLLE